MSLKLPLLDVSLKLFLQDIVNLRKFTADEFSQLHAVLMDLCKFLSGHWSLGSGLEALSLSFIEVP